MYGRVKASHLVLAAVATISIVYFLSTAPGNAPTSLSFSGQVQKVERIRTILMWTTVYGKHSGFLVVGKGGSLVGLARTCKHKCEFTDDRSALNRSHAVLFHAWLPDLKTEEVVVNGQNVSVPRDIPYTRDTNQFYVYVNLEAPSRVESNMKTYENFFNWTMTYRSDADFPVTMGRFKRKSRKEIKSYDPGKNLQNLTKKNLVAWLVSNCKDGHSPSGRNQIVRELEKHIPINVYGKCGSLKCNKSIHRDCYQELGMTHKFYLSFENSLCRDYVTEKFFKALEANMVPVVYGGANYGLQFPSGSFISTDSFASAKALADYLLYLDKNEEEYLLYFRWRKYYKLSRRFNAVEQYCQMCARLHEEYLVRSSRVNIVDWLLKENSSYPICRGPPLEF